MLGTVDSSLCFLFGVTQVYTYYALNSDPLVTEKMEESKYKQQMGEVIWDSAPIT